MATSKGFNLVEIVVAIGLFSLVGIIVLDAWVANGRLLRTGLGTVELQQEADAALERTSDAARNARAVLSSGFAGGATHSTSSSTLVLDLPGLLADGTASTTLTDIVALYRDPAAPTMYRLAIEAAAGSSRKDGITLLSDDVSDLFFTLATSTISAARDVGFQIRLSRTISGRAVTSDRAGRFHLGN